MKENFVVLFPFKKGHTNKSEITSIRMSYDLLKYGRSITYACFLRINKNDNYTILRARVMSKIADL